MIYSTNVSGTVHKFKNGNGVCVLMRTCPNCGEKLSAGSAVCPNCGAAASAPAAGGRPDPRAVGIVALAAAAVVLVIAVRAVSGLFSSPVKKFISYQKDLFVTEILSMIESGADRAGSLSAGLTVTASVDNSTIAYFLTGSSINLSVDLKEDSLIASGEAVLMGSPILNGTVTYDNGTFGFLLPQADDTYYVMDLRQVFKNLSGEDAGPDAVKLPGISGKQCRSLAEAYLDIVYSGVTKNSLKVEKNQSVSLSGLGGSFTGTVYTFTPTAEDIETMLVKLADHLERDEDLRRLLSQLMASEGIVRLISGYAPDDFDMENEVDKTLLEAAGRLRDNAGEIGRQAEDSGFTWVLAVEGKNVRQIRVSAQEDARGVVYEAEGAEAGRRTELIYAVSSGGNQKLAERSYTKKGDHSDGRVTVTIPYEGTMILDYDMDRGNTSVFGIPYGGYSLSVPGGDVSVGLKVAAGGNGGVDHIFSISADSSYFGNMFSRLDLTVNATGGSKVSKPSRPAVDISGYSEEEFHGLFSDIGNTLGSELINNIPLFSFMYGW